MALKFHLKVMPLSEVLRELAPTILRIIIELPVGGQDTRSHTLGTGFLINRDGYAFTAHHVVDFGRKLTESTGRLWSARQNLIQLNWPET